MRFDWEKFCTGRRISFEGSGTRVSKGNINIRCPFCGAADKSGHMGLSLDQRNPVWGCLRNPKHRGRDPVRLVSKLLGIALGTAQALVELAGPQLDDFERAVDAMREQPEEATRTKVEVRLALPKTFKHITNISPRYRERFMAYLHKRGFGNDVASLLSQYELLGCLTGPFAWRIIFPVKDSLGLVGWTGRDTYPGSNLRYLTSEGLPKAAILDFGQGPSQHGMPTLVCEGPMDALKLDYYGTPLGLRAVATMGTGAADLDKAAALRARFERLAVVFDSDATGQALEFAEELGAEVYFLPPGVKDPGELQPHQAKIFLQNIAQRA